MPCPNSTENLYGFKKQIIQRKIKRSELSGASSSRQVLLSATTPKAQLTPALLFGITLLSGLF